jgi:phosphatidate cytidylyltransferase
MIITLAVLFLFGKIPVQVLILIVGILACDELYANFFRQNRISINYVLMMGLLIVPFVYFNFIFIHSSLNDVFVNAALVLNILLLFYLFFIKTTDSVLIGLGKKYPYLSGIIIILPILSMTVMFDYLKWMELIVLLLIVNFSMDSGAWFFGKWLGKNKLWPEISPNKTIEGLAGGIITSGFFGSMAWWYYFGKIQPIISLSFMLLGLLSQLGDLVQSKLKRQFKLKDSSNLIPGHGGVYDRIDSLIFVTPFFAIAVKYFYFR